MKKFLSLIVLLSYVVITWAQPAINSFSPTSASTGTSIVINGSGFSATASANTVYFGAVKATVTAASSNTLTVVVPSGASYQPISVTVNRLTAFSRNAFSLKQSNGTVTLTPGSYNNPSTITVPRQSSSVVFADLDGDGKPDMIVSNKSDSSVSVYKNKSTNGALNYDPKIDFKTGTLPRFLLTGDFNGDGKLDIVCIDINKSNIENGSFTILQNNSSSNQIVLTPQKFMTESGTFPGLSTGDFDGDGKLDIAVAAMDSSKLLLYRNTSTSDTIRFGSATRIALPFPPEYLLSGDLDGDGKTDLVSSRSGDSTLYTIKNNSTAGTFSFATPVSFANAVTAISYTYLFVTDLNGDGKPDVVFSNYKTNQVSVCRNTSSSGNISFAGKVNFPVGSVPVALAVGDLDGNGSPDLLVNNTATGSTVSLLRNKSDSSAVLFDQKIDYPITNTNNNTDGPVAISDMDMDGRSDWLAIDNMGTNLTVSRLPAITDLVPVITSFTPATGPIGTSVIITGSNFSSIASANIVYFGGVKAPVTAASAGSLTVTVPSGAGYRPVTVTTNGLTAYSAKSFTVTFPGTDSISTTTFGTKQVYSSGASVFNIASGDLDGDGKTDYVAASYGDKVISLVLNTSTKGKISFADKIDSVTTDKPTGLSLADINGDGKLDIIVSNETAKTISVFRNISSGLGVLAFAAKIDFPAGIYPGSIAVADLNSDGRPDIVVTNNQDGTVSILKNTSTISTISFADRVNLTTGSSPFGVAVADVNGDGLPDICVCNQSSNSLSIFRNTSTAGNISFDANLSTYPTGTQPYNLVVADFDGDGNPDIITANLGSANISVFRNTSVNSGVVSFAAKTDIQVATSPNHISAADINGDGKPDIAISSSDQSVIVLTNKSTPGTISFPSRSAFPIQASSSCTMLSDFDNDGRPDLGVGYFSNVAFLRNQISIPILTSFSPASGKQGDTISIRGSNLGIISDVRFGGVPAMSFVLVSDSLIKATLGFGTSGKLIITGSNGYADSASGFIFNSTAAPKIVSVLPNSGPVGSTVSISGSNFSPVAADNIVYFGAVRAKITTATANNLTVTVPVAASYIPVSVTTNNLTGYSKTPFNISFSANALDLNRTDLFQKKRGDSTINKTFITDMYSHDLDGDGKVDIVALIWNGGGTNNGPWTANPGAILVALNTGSISNPSFGVQQVFATGLNPSDVTFTDIDGDGRTDILTANQNDNTISILRNISTPGIISFEAKKDFAIGSNNSFTSGYKNSVTTGDLNSDGKPDIVAAVGNSNTFSIFTNTSTPGVISFAQRIDMSGPYNTLSSPTSIVIADFNSDGKPDIALSNVANGFVSVFRNTSVNGYLTLATKQDIPINSGSYRIATDDLDGDGKLDIISGDNLSLSLHLLRNTSIGDSISFANAVNIETGSPSTNFMINNFDGNGKADIALGVSNTDSLLLLQNLSTPGSFSFTKYKYKTNKGDNFTSQIASADFDGDGLQDLASKDLLTVAGSGSNTFFIDVLLNTLSSGPSIRSFTPQSGGTGTSVTIKGVRLTGTTAVSFGSDTASSFVVVADTVITATVGLGGTGFVKVKTPNGSDSLSGFIFNTPEIILTDSSKNSLSFNVIKGVYSAAKNFSISGKRLQSAIRITAPPSFQVSRAADTGFASTISISPVNNNLDTTRIYVRCKTDSLANIAGTILIETNNAITRNITVTGIVCDSSILLTPDISPILKDSVICFKDSLTLTSTGNYSIYRWSTGDSTKSVVVKNSIGSLSLRVGAKASCLSNSSAALNLVRNTNPVPVIAATGDTTLISSSAPNYRWYLNNTLIPGSTGNKLIVKKVGFYGVETSNDKVCWDRSIDFPIVFVPVPLVNDSVKVKAYPNPASGGTFTIVATLQRATNVVARVIVTDANGIVLLQTNKFIFFGKEIKIPITVSVKGTVFAKIDINGDIQTQTVILQ